MLTTRRELCLLLPAILPGASTLLAVGFEQEASDAQRKQDQPLPSGSFDFDKLPLHISNSSAQVRNIMRGKLATGEGLEMHETTLPPGGAPTATTHHHKHSEMWLMREGTIELTVNGKSYRLGPGSVGFAASNEEHGIRNVGTTPATYFLVAMGPGAELQD